MHVVVAHAHHASEAWRLGETRLERALYLS